MLQASLKNHRRARKSDCDLVNNHCYRVTDLRRCCSSCGFIRNDLTVFHVKDDTEDFSQVERIFLLTSNLFWQEFKEFKIFYIKTSGF